MLTVSRNCGPSCPIESCSRIAKLANRDNLASTHLWIKLQLSIRGGCIGNVIGDLKLEEEKQLKAVQAILSTLLFAD